MTVTKAERLAEVHDRAMKRFDAIWSVVQDERRQCLFDRRFATIRGAQWEGQGAPLDEDAEDSGGPARMEVPKFLRPIRRVIGEYRSARKTVDFKARGGDSDRTSADNLDGLYRADENDTVGGGQAAYDNAFQEAIKGGFGGWRLRARYEDEEDEANDHQRIAIEPVFDADQALFFDAGAKAQDKSDARYAFLLLTMTQEAFEEAYPDASKGTFTDLPDCDFDWVQGDTITVAEYFEVEDASVLRRTFRQTVLDDALAANPEAVPDEQTHDDAALKADDGKLESDLLDQGYTEVRSRRIKRQRVRRYLLSGVEVLEDSGYEPGPNIPLVPLYAERSYVDGIERHSGMVRPVLDAVRINNLVVSNLAESANGPSGRTPIFAPEQVDGAILDAWASRKRERPAALLAKPIYDAEGNNVIAAGPTGWLDPDPIDPNTAALVQLMGGTIDELMGVNAAAETVPANTSAAAIELVQDRGDVNDFLWHDNFALALQCSGRIWLGMAKELYVEKDREMIAVDPEGKQTRVKLGEPRAADGVVFDLNDLNAGRYEVIVDVGPATKTRRDATVKAQLAIGEKYAALGDTANAQAAYGVAVTQMEGEGTDAFRAFIRKQGVAAGWVEPTEEEAAQIAAAQGEAQPDPNILLAQAQMVAAQAEVEKAKVQAIEAETRRIVAEAQAEKARADAAASLAGIDRADRKQVLEEVRAETDSDRQDDRLSLDAAKVMGGGNGNAA
jgi:hypothetical protein